MKHHIIKTDNYLLVVDESEIKEGDWHIATNLIKSNPLQCFAKTDKEALQYIDEGIPAKKIIAHLPLNGSPILEGVDLLPPLEEDSIGWPLIHYINEKHNQDRVMGFCDGYKKSQEKYKYTEEDLRKAWNAAYIDAMSIDEETYKPLFFEDFIQSISQPKMPIGFECEDEYVHDDTVPYPKTLGTHPKTIVNSQGQKELVGEYIF